MKKLLTLITLTLTLNVFSQTLSTEKVNFYDCNLTSNIISSKIDDWLIDNKDLTIIFIDSNYIKLNYTGESVYTKKKELLPYGKYSFDLEIFWKDSKVKIKLNNFSHISFSQYLCSGGNLENETPDCSDNDISQSMWVEFKKLSSEKSKDIFSELEVYLLEEFGNPNQF